VLGTLRGLGPLGVGVTVEATRQFVKRGTDYADFGHAAPLVHFLDGEGLRTTAEVWRVVDEAIGLMIMKVSPPASTVPLKPPPSLGENPTLIDVVRLPDGRYSLLWAAFGGNRYWRATFKRVATTVVDQEGAQSPGVEGDLKDASAVAQWVTPAGLRFVVLRDKSALLLDEKLDQPVAKLSFGEATGWSHSDILLGQRCALLEHQNQQVLVDRDFKVLGELEAKGSHGQWVLLEGPEGSPPVALHHRYSHIDTIYVTPERVTPPFKPPDLSGVIMALRCEDGTFCIDYLNAKKVRRRARFDEAEGRWVFGEGTEPPEKRVVDARDLARDGWVRTFGSPQGYCRRQQGQLLIRDYQGFARAQVPGPVEVLALDLDVGVSLGPRGLTRDPSLPARLEVAPTLRAALTGVPEGPLPRALYRDVPGFAAYLEARITERPRGREALERIGTAAKPLVAAAAQALVPLLVACVRVLEALEAPVPPSRTVPPRVPGASRTALRRAAQVFDEPLQGLVFWALDGNDPRPVVEYLLPDGGETRASAHSDALALLGLAQRPSLEPALAERILSLAECILQGLEDPQRRLTLPPVKAFEVDDDDDDVELNDASPPGLYAVSGLTESLLGKPSGHFPKKALPVALPDDPALRHEALAGWVRTRLLAGVAPSRIETLLAHRKASHFRAAVEHQGHAFQVEVVTALRKDGLSWQLHGLSGTAPAAAWHGLVDALARSLAQGADPEQVGAVPLLGASILRREDREALRKGIALTRASLGRREALQLEHWNVPKPKGVENPDHARYVMLAWLLGRVDSSEVGTTRAVFEKVEAQANKFVAHEYGALKRSRGKGEEAALSPGFAQLLRTSLVLRSSSRRDRGKVQENLILLREPSEILAAYAKELGLSPGGQEKP